MPSREVPFFVEPSPNLATGARVGRKTEQSAQNGRERDTAYRIKSVTLEDLTAFLRETSHFAMGQGKAEKILAATHGLPDEPAYQAEQDCIIRANVAQLRFLQAQLAEARSRLAALVAQTDYDLTVIPGVDVIMSAELIALIGDINRFRNPDKFVAFCGIAPVSFGSGEKENRVRSEFGRRELHSLMHQVAVYQLVVQPRTKEPRNPEAKAYYERHLGDQAARPSRERDRKTVKKALTSLMRQQALRIFKLMKAQKRAAMALRTPEAENPVVAA